MIQNFLTSWKWKCAIFSRNMSFPGDTIPIVKGSALKALEGDPKSKDAIYQLMAAVDEYIPLPERPIDQPFLDADRRCVQH